MALTDDPIDMLDPADGDTSAKSDTDDLSALADQAKTDSRPDPALVEWVMEKVNRWRKSRDNNFGSFWDKYYRIFRGKWDPSLKQKLAERSRIITPVTQSAIDQAVSEMVEAVFGRGNWFDISEEFEDPQLLAQAELTRDQLIEDFDKCRIKASVVEVFYNGGIYGEGIAKRVIDKWPDGTPYVTWVAVPPNEFVIDTAANTIDEALGCAHETIRPKHEVREKQETSEYYNDEGVDSASGFGVTDLLKGGFDDFLEIDPQDGVYITEWHGLVPTKFLNKNSKAPDDTEQDLYIKDELEKAGDEPTYTECVVTIGNGAQLLKCEVNEIQDRGVVAYQHYRAPNQFWGIGIAEKAFNAQIGLDGEVRARADALALTTYPSVGVDATRMPRNLQTQVGPGKVYLTNGNPDEIIRPISFGTLQNSSFEQSGDLERYAQLATGASDPAKPVNGNTTASGQSQASSSYIKRAKLTMQAVDTDFLSPLVRKTILAYNAIDPKRYPTVPGLIVNSTMSIMAREFEQMQMTNLLAIVPQESPAFPVILKGIIENYSGPSKDKIIAAIDEAMKPDPQQQQMQQAIAQLQMAEQKGKVDKLSAETEEVRSRVGVNQAKATSEGQKAKLAIPTFRLQMEQLENAKKQTANQTAQNEISAAKVQVDHHHQTEEHRHKRVANMIAMHDAHSKRITAEKPPATPAG